MNWRARPLESPPVVITNLAPATTRTRLKVRAGLDTSPHEKGINNNGKEMKGWEPRHPHHHKLNHASE